MQLDDKPDRSVNTDHVCKRLQSRLFWKTGILQRLQKNAADVLPVGGFQRPLLWGCCIARSRTERKDLQRLDKLIKKATSVVGADQDAVATVAERKAWTALWQADGGGDE